MKTAEQWAKRVQNSKESWEKLVELIQNDAIKHGMILASRIVRSQPVHSDFHLKMDGAEHMMADKIIAKANEIEVVP